MGRAQGRWKAGQGLATSLTWLEERLLPSNIMAHQTGFCERYFGGGDIFYVVNEIKELRKVKELLELEGQLPRNFGGLPLTGLPILHNKDRVYLQFCGWSINLHADGTWIWEDTGGG